MRTKKTISVLLILVFLLFLITFLLFTSNKTITPEEIAKKGYYNDKHECEQATHKRCVYAQVDFTPESGMESGAYWIAQSQEELEK